MRKCTDCKFLVLTDEGYSNWTVENTTATCLHNNNPGFPCDNYYGEVHEHSFAEKCELFSAGDPVHFDVDREEGKDSNYATDPTVKLMLMLEEKD